jgi:hypothetical protein
VPSDAPGFGLTLNETAFERLRAGNSTR